MIQITPGGVAFLALYQLSGVLFYFGVVSVSLLAVVVLAPR